MKKLIIGILTIFVSISVALATGGNGNRTDNSDAGDGTFPVMISEAQTDPGDGTFPVLSQFAVLFDSELNPQLPNCVIFSFRPPVEMGESVMRTLEFPDYNLIQTFEIGMPGDGTFPTLRVKTKNTESGYEDNFNSHNPNSQMNLFEIEEEETYQTFVFPEGDEDLTKKLKNENCILR